MAKKIKKVNGLVIAELSEKDRKDQWGVDGIEMADRYQVYTKDEWDQPQGFRYPEMGCDSLAEAIGFAECY